MAGATFAISLDAINSTGGTIDNVNLCNALVLPNGITTVNKLKAYAFAMPFGNVGTTAWGVYMDADAENYMRQSLKIGSGDTVSNSSVGFELASTTRAVLLSRMTTAERDALTAIDGMLIYNTTLGKLQGYEGGVWASLI